jgi:transposase
VLWLRLRKPVCHAGKQRRIFGVSVRVAIEWVWRFRETGSVAPGKIGGYKPKKISGAYRDWLLERCHEKEFTLRGLVAELGERGLKVDYRSVWELIVSPPVV